MSQSYETKHGIEYSDTYHFMTRKEENGVHGLLLPRTFRTTVFVAFTKREKNPCFFSFTFMVACAMMGPKIPKIRVNTVLW